MKKWYVCYFVLLSMTSAGYSQNSIGPIEIQPSIADTNGTVFKVSAKNIHLDGYKDQMLRAIVYIYKNSDIKNSAVVYKDIDTSKAVVSIPVMEFEFRHSLLAGIYGSGKQKLRVWFYIYNYSTPTPTLCPDTYKRENIEVEISGAPDSKTREYDLANEEYKKARAQTNPDYVNLRIIEAEYGITVLLHRFTYGTSVQNQASWEFLDKKDESLIDLAVKAFVKSWRGLTVEFVKATGLKRVAFVKNVTYSGAMLEQTSAGGRDVGGMFDTVDMMVLVDAQTVHNTMFGVMHVIFHEYFHIIENVLYSKHYFRTEEWAALNPEGFRYQRDIPGKMLSFSIADEHPIPGFVTGYSATDQWQDRADLFAYIVDSRLSRRLSRYLENDPFLNRKVDFMKKRIIQIAAENK